jgi:hypothetical protein
MKSQLKKVLKYLTPDNGKEVLNPEPLHVTLNIEQDDPIEVRIKKLIASERMRDYAEKTGMDTIDEASDFDVGGADEIVTGYEAVMMADEYIANTPEQAPDAVPDTETSTPTVDETKTPEEATK